MKKRIRFHIVGVDLWGWVIAKYECSDDFAIYIAVGKVGA